MIVTDSVFFFSLVLLICEHAFRWKEHERQPPERHGTRSHSFVLILKLVSVVLLKFCSVNFVFKKLFTHFLGCPYFSKGEGVGEP